MQFYNQNPSAFVCIWR